jgi:hypothetical protein
MNKLPFNVDLDKIELLRELSNANNSIGELKGILKLFTKS